jgi:hypothetical protein
MGGTGDSLGLLGECQHGLRVALSVESEAGFARTNEQTQVEIGGGVGGVTGGPAPPDSGAMLAQPCQGVGVDHGQHGGDAP